MLYTLIVVFAATTVGSYFRFREVERRYAEIVGADAIRDATLTHGILGEPRENGATEGAAPPSCSDVYGWK
jgi:hypothetical protein